MSVGWERRDTDGKVGAAVPVATASNLGDHSSKEGRRGVFLAWAGGEERVTAYQHHTQIHYHIQRVHVNRFMQKGAQKKAG